LLGLINEILDFSKVEASKIELEHIEFNLVELIDEICYLQGEPADRKGLSLNGIFEGLITDKLYGDPTKIRQVIMNLVSNSIKFTHQGNVNVRVSFENNKIDTERPTLRITVEDQGIGMDSATQDRIFEAFTQADASTTREYGGTGLGLAISRHYIDLMGGKIEVSSELGAGTIITVSLPMEAENSTYDIGIAKSLSKAVIETSNQSTYEMISSHLSLLGSSSDRYRDIETIIQEADMIVIDYNTKQFESKAKTLASFKGRKLGIIATPLTGSVIPKCCSDWISVTKPVTLLSLKAALESYANNLSGNKVNTTKPITSETRSILVAEDVETNQKIAREMISMLGYQVDIAENGKEALTKFGAKNYDLIFMDCQMPIMDGYDATMKIRAIEEEGHEKRTPIVALTAGFNKDDRDRCNLVGMDYYLTKPFSVSDISRVLKRFVGDSQLDYDEKPATNQDPGILAQSAEDPTDVNNEIFNIAAIENIKEVEKQTGRALLPSIFQGFVEQMNDKLCEINTHIESGDARSIYRTAHAIKSMSANIGAEKVRSISAQIEAAGRANNLENLDEFIEHLDYGYNEFISTFESEFMAK
jgi:CheY-like chemotaxis protein/HPt (histidine-containing phosphotransfer) domain-containing protein/anti-sigma regulatory factor (Ser/Thr protein kinase)